MTGTETMTENHHPGEHASPSTAKATDVPITNERKEPSPADNSSHSKPIEAATAKEADQVQSEQTKEESTCTSTEKKDKVDSESSKVSTTNTGTEHLQSSSSGNGVEQTESKEQPSTTMEAPKEEGVVEPDGASGSSTESVDAKVTEEAKTAAAGGEVVNENCGEKRKASSLSDSSTDSADSPSDGKHDSESSKRQAIEQEQEAK